MADKTVEVTEPPEELRSTQKAKRITHIVLHVLLHVAFIAYFSAATYVYVTYDRNSADCFPPAPVTEEPENTTEIGENTTGVEEMIKTTTPIETTSSESPPKKITKFRSFVLCEFNWCRGYGFLVVIFVLFYILWFYYWVFKPYVGIKLYNKCVEPMLERWIKFSRTWLVSGIMLTILLALVFAFVGYECSDDASKAFGLLGPVVFILTGFAMSTHHKKVQWRIVTHGILGQLLLGIICLRLEIGRSVFNCIGIKITKFLNYTSHGARFVYGDRICDDYVFAFSILAVVFFFSVVVSVMYYLGWMQFVLNGFGFLLQATIGTTVCESVTAAGNVFLGMSESPLLIRPYIYLLTNSEIHCICTSGYASVSGTVLGAFVAFGASPTFLVTASVMAAPGSLAFSKLIYPETETSVTRAENIKIMDSSDTSILDAITSGAAAGLMIVLAIVSNIIAILSIFFFLNALTEWFFELLDLKGITLLFVLSHAFMPVVFLMGVPYHDCRDIGMVVAEKTLLNEFVGYKHLGQLIEGNKVDAKSAAIATFALCGFANPGSLGILIAALSAMAPTRRSDITRVAVRAFFAGTFVSFTSASIAGILFNSNNSFWSPLSKDIDEM